MNIRMQILDSDYFMVNGKPTIRIFGKQEDGSSVCLFVDGVKPYFYVEKNDKVEDFLKDEGIEYEVVDRKPAIGYQPGMGKMFKVILENPQNVPERRAQLEKYGKCYEADMLFKYRFMVDNNLRGMGWLEAEAEPVRTSAARIPSYRMLSIRPMDNPKNSQLRFLSIDIECLQLDTNRLPDAERDPIVVVALAFFPAFDGKQSMVLAAKSVSGSGTSSFQGEKEMLESLQKTIDQYDPDIITGYNINGFDVPYLLTRFRKMKLSSSLGRSDKSVRSRTFMGGQETEIAGRVVADVYQLLKKDVSVRLQRYDLGTVAREMLGASKGDVKFSDMRRIWAQEPLRLVEYARQDAMLALRLLLERRIMDKFIEISRISGPLLQDCMRGRPRASK